ncbi:MAG: biotin/lipoyl-containing protein, partial [Bacteroidota bacterium]|nr:biotin/lipoyl-containing protein [Bacteroidota bacterium]
LEAAKAKAGAPIVITRPVVEVPKVDIDKVTEKFPNAKPVQSPVRGQIIWQYDILDVSKAPNIGDKVKAGEPVCYVQSTYGPEAVLAGFDGKIVATYPKQGEMVQKGEIVAFIE